jgi:hypothetical protein
LKVDGLRLRAAGTPMPSASSCLRVGQAGGGSTKTLMIFSGVLCATSSMSMPPSLLSHDGHLLRGAVGQRGT